MVDAQSSTELKQQSIIFIKSHSEKNMIDLDEIIADKLYVLQYLPCIKNDTINKLWLKSNNITDNELKYLQQASLKNLAGLWLRKNKIINLSIFIKMPFQALQQLHLDHNKIQNLEPLIKFNFPNLKQLDLADNFICNLQPLKKIKFKYLQMLDLQDNSIWNIESLEKTNLPSLFKLRLKNNKVCNIERISLSQFKLTSFTYDNHISSKVLKDCISSVIKE